MDKTNKAEALKILDRAFVALATLRRNTSDPEVHAAIDEQINILEATRIIITAEIIVDDAKRWKALGLAKQRRFIQ